MWRRVSFPCSRRFGSKDGDVSGYVKPMFANLEVYDYQKDKRTGVLHQAKELLIGGASHIFKNSGTRRLQPRLT